MSKKQNRRVCKSRKPKQTRLAHVFKAAASHPLIADRYARVTSTSRVSMFIDLAWAVGNLAVGALQGSFWLITFGAYYALIFALRLAMLRAARIVKPNTLRSTLIASGIALGASVVGVIGIAILSISAGNGNRGSEIAVISAATYTFWSLGVNIAGAVSTHKAENALFGLKCIGTARTLFSMLALEITMVLTFESASGASSKTPLTIMTSALVVASLAVTSFILIRKGKSIPRR